MSKHDGSGICLNITPLDNTSERVDFPLLWRTPITVTVSSRPCGRQPWNGDALHWCVHVWVGSSPVHCILTIRCVLSTQIIWPLNATISDKTPHQWWSLLFLLFHHTFGHHPALRKELGLKALSVAESPPVTEKCSVYDCGKRERGIKEKWLVLQHKSIHPLCSKAELEGRKKKSAGTILWWKTWNTPAYITVFHSVKVRLVVFFLHCYFFFLLKLLLPTSRSRGPSFWNQAPLDPVTKSVQFTSKITIWQDRWGRRTICNEWLTPADL